MQLPPKQNGIHYYLTTETYRTGRAGDPGAGSAQKLFIRKPYVHGFPDN
jgi:hypothetical protein